MKRFSPSADSPSVDPSNVRLYCISGPLKGREFTIATPTFRIGSDQSNDMVISGDDFVSGHHAQLRNERGDLWIVDQESKNGTFINGDKIGARTVPVNIGDQVRLGGSTFELRSSRAHGDGEAAGSAFPAPRPPEWLPGDARLPRHETQLPELLELPTLGKGQRLDLRAIRDPREKIYLPFVYLPSIAVAVLLIWVAFDRLEDFYIALASILFLTLLAWISWKLLCASLLGNCIRVGARQYPQINNLVREASDILGIEPPEVFVMQGHGLFEVLVAKYFSRRGFMILTSNLIDDLTEHGSSRELMFFVGRQLGLIANGYFRLWAVKHTLGQYATFFYWAWMRRCHFTADRLGLLVAGDLYAAEQALVIITAGSAVAPSTNIDDLRRQRVELFHSLWSWIGLAFSGYPYMVDRIVRMSEFAYDAAAKGLQANAPLAVAALPITHRPIRSLSLMVIHGHDGGARLELENFLLRQFPHVALITMINETESAYSLPEKFERLAGRVKGAVALLTPDDIAVTVRSRAQNPRARQNVILEIGWMWGTLGRERCLLLTRGDLDVPSDLSGVELHRFNSSPLECSERLREFIAKLEVR